MLIEAIVSLLLLIGASFVLIGSVGLARLPDFLTRLHGPTKATTLGIGGIVLASLLHAGAAHGSLSLRNLTISLFLFLTAPISAHVLAKAALKRGSGESADRSSSPID